jgi:23S rRNA (guanosine2251-2'-O)-methyltransferase
VEEAFAAHREALRLLVVPERRAALDQLVLHATTLRIPVVEVEGGTLTSISGFDGHQGVALVVAPRHQATLDEVLAIARSRGEPPFVLVLDHLEDPQNVGALMRSAEASGVHGVILPAHGSAPLSPAAVKSSAGAAEHLAVVIVPDLAAGLADLHTRGLRIVGADGDAPMTVREVDLRGPLAVVVGNEGRGLTSRLRRRMDVTARIPMRGRVASLNASVAGSIFLYEAATQRGLPESEAAAETGTDALSEAPAESELLVPQPLAPEPGATVSEAADSDPGNLDAPVSAERAARKDEPSAGGAAIGSDHPATNKPAAASTLKKPRAKRASGKAAVARASGAPAPEGQAGEEADDPDALLP